MLEFIIQLTVPLVIVLLMWLMWQVPSKTKKAWIELRQEIENVSNLFPSTITVKAFPKKAIKSMNHAELTQGLNAATEQMKKIGSESEKTIRLARICRTSSMRTRFPAKW